MVHSINKERNLTINGTNKKRYRQYQRFTGWNTSSHPLIFALLTNWGFTHILKLKYLIKILFVCPLLEDLLIKNVTTNDDNHTLDALTKQTDKLLKPFPKLLKAHISDSSSISSFLPLKLFYNVEFLRAQVAVQTPLKLFNYVTPVQTTQFFNLTRVELSFEKRGWGILLSLSLGLVEEVHPRLPLSSKYCNS